MRLRTILVIATAAAALSACYRPFMHGGHGPYRTLTALTCPDSQGELTRKSATPDGKSCDYTSSDGGIVTLQLVALNGADINTALSPLETKLRADVPSTDKTTPDEGRVDIDLPGIHIHAAGKDNEHGGGQVRIGRDVTINGGGATNTTSTADEDRPSGEVNIEAHDNGAEIRVDETRGGMRRVFFLASDTPGPSGYKVAGYEARGPKAGPLVVASMLSKSDDHDELRHDAARLIRLNVGG